MLTSHFCPDTSWYSSFLYPRGLRQFTDTLFLGSQRTNRDIALRARARFSAGWSQWLRIWNIKFYICNLFAGINTPDIGLSHQCGVSTTSHHWKTGLQSLTPVHQYTQIQLVTYNFEPLSILDYSHKFPQFWAQYWSLLVKRFFPWTNSFENNKLCWMNESYIVLFCNSRVWIFIVSFRKLKHYNELSSNICT